MFERVRNYSGAKDLQPGIYLVRLEKLEYIEADWFQSGAGNRWTFEVFQYPTGAPVFDELGERVRIQELSSTSLGRQAKARQWAEALLGRPLKEGEGGPELVQELIGRAAIATVVFNDKGYPKIQSVAPVPPTLQLPLLDKH